MSVRYQYHAKRNFFLFLICEVYKRIIIFCCLPLQHQLEIFSLSCLGSCVFKDIFIPLAVTQLYRQFWVQFFRLVFYPNSSFKKLQGKTTKVICSIMVASYKGHSYCQDHIGKHIHFFSWTCLITPVLQTTLQGKIPLWLVNALILLLINTMLNLFWSSHNLF